MLSNSQTDSFFKEITSQIRKDKFFSLIKKHQKIISGFLATLILLSIFYACWSWYQQGQAKKYSAILHQATVDEQNGEIEKYNLTLKQIYQSSAPSGVRQIASLQYANSLAKDDKNNEAIEVYLKINNDKNFDQYVREYAGLIALKISVDNFKLEEKDKTLSLANQLEKSSKILKYHIVEQKGLLLWNLKDFKAANELFESLVNNPEANDSLQQRAKEMVGIYKSKFSDTKIK